MKNFPTGIKDVDREILSKLPDEDVIKSCSLNKYLREKVCDESFFERRMRENYPELKITVGYRAYGASGIYPNYKEAYLETVYYISKMKEINYDYVPSRSPPKIQYHRAKQVHDIISRLKKHKYEAWRGVAPLRDIIKMEDLNLIKYAMKLYDFDTDTQRDALSYANMGRYLDIVKYFADREGADLLTMEKALKIARKNGTIEMIKYFESKLA